MRRQVSGVGVRMRRGPIGGLPMRAASPLPWLPRDPSRITEVSGAQVDINDEGKVLIFATDKESMDRAILEVDACTAEIEVGKTYRGIVRGVKDFGAFVECLPGKEGLVHISELADFRVNQTEDICKLGDEMVVKCIGVEKGKVRLSRKAALEEAKEESEEETTATE